MIYFDNAATTYPKPESVYNKLDYSNRNFAFNAGRGESHESEIAMNEIVKSREAIADFLPNISPKNVVFSNSATDALNKIILGMDLVEGDVVYISPFEHNAIVRPLKRLESSGVKIKVLPFDPDTWELNEEETKKEFAIDNPTAVFVSHVSNVTGYILPFAKIFSLSKKYNSVNILDSSQGFGIVPLNDISSVSYIVFAGHKTLYGSFGVGGFIVVNDAGLLPVIAGGTGSDSLNTNMPDELPTKYESGSLNVVAISSLNTSCDWLKNNNVLEHEKELSSHLLNALNENKKIKVFYPKELETNGIVSIAVDGYSSSEVGLFLQSRNISVRTGYHCAPLIHKFIGSLNYEGTVRISFGAFNTKKEVDDLVDALKEL